MDRPNRKGKKKLGKSRPQPKDFMEIGGSPVPGLNLRRVLRGRLRSNYETHLVRVKGFRRDRTAPRCYISHLPEHSTWAAQLTSDLREAGVYILEDRAQIQASDFVVLIGTPAYKQAWDRSAESVAEETNLIRARVGPVSASWPTVIPL